MRGALATGKSQMFASFQSAADGTAESVHSAEWLATPTEGRQTTTIDIAAYRAGATPASRAPFQENIKAPTLRDNLGRDMVPSSATNSMEIPWLNRTIDGNRDAWSKQDLARIKSVGKVPKKTTPTPTHVTFSRDSIAIEKLDTAGGRKLRKARKPE